VRNRSLEVEHGSKFFTAIVSTSRFGWDLAVSWCRTIQLPCCTLRSDRGLALVRSLHVQSQYRCWEERDVREQGSMKSVHSERRLYTKSLVRSLQIKSSGRKDCVKASDSVVLTCGNNKQAGSKPNSTANPTRQRRVCRPRQLPAALCLFFSFSCSPRSTPSRGVSSVFTRIRTNQERYTH
jgi:hypothetical protein